MAMSARDVDKTKKLIRFSVKNKLDTDKTIELLTIAGIGEQQTGAMDSKTLTGLAQRWPHAAKIGHV
jgi:hypothetical protein